MAKNSIAKKHPIAGFTLIELLVTIVIIGILVGIGTVSYNGIMKQNRQKDLENSLIDAAGKVQNYISKNNKLPIGLSDVGVKNSGGVTYTFRKGEFPKFCIEGVRSGSTFSITNSASAVTDGSCTFMSGGDIQTATKSNCPATRTIVVDQRDRKTYYIQKLGNDCWMLTNLAYAGGGTNTSTRQYGYLYNWCAAMGGQNTAACANASTPVTIPTTNICPAGWRLPTSNGGEFTALNNAINSGSTSSDAGLLSNGLFQRSGIWNGTFNSEDSVGYYWSSSQSADNAFRLQLGVTSVNPASYSIYKYNGFSVRCVAQ